MWFAADHTFRTVREYQQYIQSIFRTYVSKKRMKVLEVWVVDFSQSPLGLHQEVGMVRLSVCVHMYICIYISISTVYTTLYLSFVQATSYTMLSVNYTRMQYEMQLTIGELQYTVFYAMPHVRVYIVIG